MNRHSRRQFGADMLRAAAVLGLRSITGSQLARLAAMGSALGVSGCSDSQKASSERLRHQASPGDSGTTGDAGGDYADVLIVGSGYGGAVVAKRLTERGVKVRMLEKGRLWNTPGPDGKIFCGILNADGRALWFRDDLKVVTEKLSPVAVSQPIPKQAGALDIIQTPEVDVFCGRGVGGGSLVNMAMLVTPPRDVLQRTLSMVDADAMLSTYYPRALAMLKANTIRRAFFDTTPWYQYARVGYQSAQAAGFDAEFLPSGYDYSYMEEEAAGAVPASALNDEGGFGNNYGKQSLDKTYIADAMATGNLMLESLVTVKELRRNRDGTYVVATETIDVDGNVVARKEITCKRLFLSAGSMGTSELLVRSRETGTLPDLNDRVGTGWGPNSDIFLMRDDTPTMTGAQISMVPATGFRTVDQDGKQVFSMDIPFPAGFETFTSFSIVMTENPESGTFRYNPDTGVAELQWTAAQNAPAVASAKYVFDKMNAAAGTRYSSNLLGGKQFQDSATYHAVGGCPLGEATDDYGRVKGYDGLYISDGSLIPRGVVANPSLTITALAERNIEQIALEDF
jgi:cholesterol oxidase